jgi:hypothetical protein
MKQGQVWTFFYGSYINLNVLKEVDLIPEQYEVARLPGFDIHIGPLAQNISGAKRVLIPKAGHLPHMEQPTEFNRIILEFLRQSGISAP